MGEKEGSLTISTIPSGWTVSLAGSTCNYGSVQSISVTNPTTLKFKCINLSNATHTITGTIVLLYYPSNVIY